MPLSPPHLYLFTSHKIKLYPDIKRTLVTMSERTEMSVSQVTDEVLYTGLIEMQEMDEL